MIVGITESKILTGDFVTLQSHIRACKYRLYSFYCRQRLSCTFRKTFMPRRLGPPCIPYVATCDVVSGPRPRPSQDHRRRRRGDRGTCPHPNSGKYFWGKNHVKFGHFVNFSCTYFRAKMSCPPKLTELLRLCSRPK